MNNETLIANKVLRVSFPQGKRKKKQRKTLTRFNRKVKSYGKAEGPKRIVLLVMRNRSICYMQTARRYFCFQARRAPKKKSRNTKRRENNSTSWTVGIFRSKKEKQINFGFFSAVAYFKLLLSLLFHLDCERCSAKSRNWFVAFCCFSFRFKNEMKSKAEWATWSTKTFSLNWFAAAYKIIDSGGGFCAR